MSDNEIILYQPDRSISLEVRVENETIWLTQKQMAQLYGTAVPAISKHIKNIFDSGELQAEATVSKMEIVQKNYIDESVLLLLSKRNSGVPARIITRKISPLLAVDLAKHNQQYPLITIEESLRYHDRFLIIDGTVYHVGASLKDLGKKLFAFSKLDVPAEMLVM